MPLLISARRFLDTRLTPVRANFWCHVVEGAFATFGGELAGAGVVFAVLAARLGVSPSGFGFLSSLGAFSFLAPLLFAPRVEATRHKKRLVLLLGIGQRLPRLLVAGLLVALAARHPFACLLAIALVNLGGGLATSVLVAPWMDLVAETIPPDRHGRVFGYRHAISSTLGLAAGPAAGVILAVFVFPWNYATLYLASFALMMVSWFLFALVDELPDHAAPPPRRRAPHYFRELFTVLRADPTYHWFLLHNLVNRVGSAAAVFYPLVAVRFLGMKPAFAVGAWIAALSAARILGNLSLAPLADRVGHKRVLNLGAAARAAAAVLAATAPSGMWYIGVAFLLGLGGAAQTVSGGPFMMRVAPRGRRIGYQTVSMTIMAPVGMAVAVGAGFGLTHAGWSVPFLAGAVLILASQLALERCRPRPLEAEAAAPVEKGAAGDVS